MLLEVGKAEYLETYRKAGELPLALPQMNSVVAVVVVVAVEDVVAVVVDVVAVADAAVADDADVALQRQLRHVERRLLLLLGGHVAFVDVDVVLVPEHEQQLLQQIAALVADVAAASDGED